MANQITDGRTIITASDAVGSWTGSGDTPALDTEVFYEGTGSVSMNTNNSRRTLLWNFGSAQNFSNNHFFILVNCGVVGSLLSKAAGGFTIRFTGPTTTNFFEFYVGGNDSWPTSFAGGWTLFVVDIEATPSNTGGTPPATSAIQYVGWSSQTTNMLRTNDNTWTDTLARLPDGSAGVIIEGQNGGSTPWNWSNVLSASTTGAWGTVREGAGGAVVLSAPIQFGINDTTTHVFEDSSQTLLWDNQEFVAADYYGFRALGNAGGTTSITAGVKSGTGTDATGSQGWTISAASTGVRWYMDMNDANLDSIGFYGCSFQHGSTFDLNSAAVETISTLFSDCTLANLSGSFFSRNTVVNANTADATAFIVTNTLSDIVNCNFQFSDGHAIQITATGTYSFVGNIFSGYGGTPTTGTITAAGSTDAAIWNSTGTGTVTVNVSGGGSTPTIRNSAGSTTVVNNNVSVDIKVQDAATNPIQSAVVAIYNSADNTELFNGLTDSNGDITTASIANGTALYIRIRKSTTGTRYIPVETVTTLAGDTALTITMIEDLIAV